MELDTEGSPLVGVASYDFASFSVPQLDNSVEARAQEPSAIIRKADISDCFLMALIGTDALSVRHDIPNLHSAVMTRTQQKVTSLREELDPLHAFVVARPGVKPLFWYEAVVILVPQVRWCIHKALVSVLVESSSSVVDCFSLEKGIVLLRV